MEPWSDAPLSTFRIKVFMDTNILTYLMDNSYPNLTKAIEFLRGIKFVDLISSEFVVYEFVGVRKREYFLRKIIEASSSSGKLNVSSLLRYREKFVSQEVDFESVMPDIKNEVLGELEKITNDLGVTYNGNTFHRGLLKPTFDICLSSKISKEDSLVLISAIFPAENKIENSSEQILILSNDKDFCDDFNSTVLDREFAAHELNKPTVEHIKTLKCKSGKQANLQDLTINSSLEQIIIEKLTDLIVEKNSDRLLGHTFLPANPSISNSIICFKLIANKVLNPNSYLTIISKDLNFIYTTRFAVTDFRHNGPQLQLPFSSPEDQNISFRIFEFNDDQIEVDLDENILKCLRETENFVFIHPDSIV